MNAVHSETISFYEKQFPVSFASNRKNFISESRWHEALEMKYVVSGKITMLLDTKTVTASEGELIVINPHEVHSNILVGEQTGQYHILMMDLDFFATVGINMLDLQKIMLEKQIRFRNLVKNPKICRIFEELSWEHAHAEPYWRLAFTAKLQYLLAELLRSEINTDAFPEQMDEKIKFYRSIEPAVMALRDQYQDTFTGKQLSDLCKINHNYFCRIFKRAMGMTPVQYQNECRFRVADILLSDEHLRISEIAAMVGFRDEAYFSRAYKKVRGISPQQAKSILSK